MTLLWASFLWGAAFGCAARWGRFCLLRGVRQGMGHDHSEPRGHAPALQAFALALAVALLASQGLQWLGVIDLGQAQIVRPSFSPLGVFLGGVIFALGMVLANACGARSLVLLAGGNLRALVTVVFLALGAQASATGVLAPLRQWLQGVAPVTLEHATAPQYLIEKSLSALTVYALTAIIPALLLAAYAVRHPALRRHPAQALSALAIGALVTLGWWISATVQVDPFESAKLTSLSFIAPMAESLLYQVKKSDVWAQVGEEGFFEDYQDTLQTWMDQCLIFEDSGITPLGMGAAPFADFLKKEQPLAKLKLFPNIDNAFLDLATGRVAAVVHDTPNVQYYAATAGKGRVVVTGALKSGDFYGVAFPKGSPLVAKVNTALADLKKSGEYGKIYQKWFGTKPH